MHLIYWHAEKNYEKALEGVLVEGAAAAGITITVKPTAEYNGPEADGSLIFGITKREILWQHLEERVPLLYLDKGYARSRIDFNGQSVPAWWRMCWQSVHPTHYLMDVPRPPDRWKRMGLQLSERALNSRGPIVILGSSGKFHLTVGLDDPTTWAKLIRDGIRQSSDNEIIYRPKPSWKYAEPVDGTTFDWGTKSDVRDTLRGAYCAVTWGSIACVDAICAGIPCIVQGNAVAAPVSSPYIRDVWNPIWMPRAQREQWAANLAYCNFTPAEIGDGTAFKILKEQAAHAF